MRRSSSKVALLAGALLLSGEVQPSLAACSVPNAITNNTVTDASKLMGNFGAIGGCVDAASPGGATNAIQYNNGSGGFGGTSPLTDGKIVIGATGGAPQASQLTAGAGVSIVNGPGSITVSTTGSGTGAAVDWLNKAAVVKPTASAFTMRTSTTAPTGSAISATGRGMLLSTTASPSGKNLLAETALPSGHWQATMLGVYTGPLSNWTSISFGIRDTTNNRAITLGLGSNNGSSTRFDYVKFNGGIGLDNYVGDTPLTDVGLPYPTEPIWSRLTYDGTNLIWAFSQDGEHFTTAFSVSATDYLTNLNTIGPIVTIGAPSANPTWGSGFHIFSWQLVSI
ncbi:hypothetical protein [Rhizobium sp. C4]|uniref:hypothetical protein n=1 Tax=Rhizobium sp. C4 TaxID=1349800 RepID=UPI001E319866|nr:hypothetical protein [Rhizobium sp. C4]MCD2175035.1 hypothetical protein [Rhizobium sp. C4]